MQFQLISLYSHYNDNKPEIDSVYTQRLTTYGHDSLNTHTQKINPYLTAELHFSIHGNNFDFESVWLLLL